MKKSHDEIDAFIGGVENDQRRDDSLQLLEIIKAVSHEQPVLWGSIIGFGTFHYVYESGREGDTMIVGFSPRKDALVVYGLVNNDQDADIARTLGNVKLGKSCIYIKKLSDIDQTVLKQMAERAFALHR